MERIFYTIELMAGVSNLILAFFLHFSRVPKHMKNLRKLHARICLEAAYIIMGGLSLALAFAESHLSGSLGALKAFFIQGIAPIQVLLLSWAFLIPLYNNEKIDRMMGGQLAGALLLLIANTVYYFGFGGRPGSVVAYALLGVYVALAVFCVVLFVRLGGEYLKNHPERIGLIRMRVMPLWVALGVLVVLSVLVSVYPDVVFQLVFTALYTMLYFIFALKYHNSLMADMDREAEERSALKAGSVVMTCPEKAGKAGVIKVEADDIPDNALKMKYVDVGSRLSEWLDAKSYLHPGVTIQGLSKSIGVNRTYLSNYINETYHVNFNTWLNTLRVEEAKRRIAESASESLAEIAEEVGFADLAHFSKQFKQLEGISPSVYRKGVRETTDVTA